MWAVYELGPLLLKFTIARVDHNMRCDKTTTPN